MPTTASPAPPSIPVIPSATTAMVFASASFLIPRRVVWPASALIAVPYFVIFSPPSDCALATPSKLFCTFPSDRFVCPSKARVSAFAFSRPAWYPSA